MSFHNKKRIVWFKQACLESRIQAIWLVICLPLAFLHEFLHIFFGILFWTYSYWEINHVMKITGANLNQCNLTCHHTYNGENTIQHIGVFISSVSPLLIPIILYLILGELGLIWSIWAYKSWRLSNQDKIAIKESLNRTIDNINPFQEIELNNLSF